jgi:hypothetical protein
MDDFGWRDALHEAREGDDECPPLPGRDAENDEFPCPRAPSDVSLPTSCVTDSCMSECGTRRRDKLKTWLGLDGLKARLLLNKMANKLKIASRSEEGLTQVRKVIPQFVQSSVSFLTSSSPQVLAEAASVLARCAAHFPDIVKAQDLTVLRAKYADLEFDCADGADAVRAQRLAQVRSSLRAVLGGIIKLIDGHLSDENPWVLYGMSEHIELVLRLRPRTHTMTDRATLQPAFSDLMLRVVNLSGVLSATVEERPDGSFLVLMCRPDVIAFDHGAVSFADRLGAVADQLGFVAQVVQTPVPHLEVEHEEAQDEDCDTNSSATLISPRAPRSQPTAPPSPCEASSKGFADEITDAALSARFHSMAGGNQWSFFGKATLLGGQVVEHGEDPDVTARLARIKARDQTAKSTWASRLFAPLRS